MLTIHANDYIIVARALDYTQVRIMLRHILPNAIPTLVVIATLDVASATRTEAGLSFLGLGVPSLTPSWGNILSEGRRRSNAVRSSQLILEWRLCWRCWRSIRWGTRCVIGSIHAYGE